MFKIAPRSASLERDQIMSEMRELESLIASINPKLVEYRRMQIAKHTALAKRLFLLRTNKNRP